MNEKNMADELLQEVLNYYYGVGKYDFSKLATDIDRAEASLEARNILRDKIKKYLNDKSGS